MWPLWLINSGYPWVVRRFVPDGSTVVELGCAGGVNYFGRRYRMIGCDLSFASLRMLKGIYHCLVQADAAECLPFPSACVDAVVSSYFWEHIPPDVKPRILAECARVLRPGGKLVFLYDVETRNPLIDMYKKRDFALYDHLFLKGDAHLGYQPPHENVQLFAHAGFSVLRHCGLEKTPFQSASAFYKLGQYPGMLSRLLARGTALGTSRLFYPYTVFLRLLDTTIGRFLPADWARMDLVVCERNPS